VTAFVIGVLATVLPRLLEVPQVTIYETLVFAGAAAGIFLYFFREVPVHRAGLGGGSLALGLRIALCSMPLAYALMAALPGHAFSLPHVLFAGGFSLLTLIVASRVVLGHSGQS